MHGFMSHGPRNLFILAMEPEEELLFYKKNNPRYMK